MCHDSACESFRRGQSLINRVSSRKSGQGFEGLGILPRFLASSYALVSCGVRIAAKSLKNAPVILGISPALQELILTLITESNLSAMLMLLVYGVVAAKLGAREQNFSRQWPVSLKWESTASGQNRRGPAIERPSRER